MPLTKIACLGLSHRTAPVSLRERISCALPAPDLLTQLAGETGGRGDFAALQEIAIVSTCNRIELYAVIDTEVAEPEALLHDYLSAVHTVNPATFAQHTYFYSGRDAVQHLARVACGLDSLVLGEPQILGQVNDAYLHAIESHTIGPVLDALFRMVIRSGKRARSETSISSNPASISSVSITLAQQIVGNLENKRTLIVGLGEMGQLALKALRKRGIEGIALANRSRSRAEKLAASWGGAVYSLEELPQAVAEADLVITATAAPNAIIDTALVRPVLAWRDERPLVFVDIAVPRNIAPEVGRLPGVHLFNVDDLQDGLDEALSAREQEIPRVEAIIAEEIAELEADCRQLAVRPLIADLRQRAEAIRQRELERSLNYLGDDVDPQTLEQLQHLSRSLVNKLLHEPTIRLRQKASNGQANQYAETVRDLFNLNSPPRG